MEISQIVLISGAASGLGAATAELLSTAGAKVVLLDRDHSRVTQLAAHVSGHAFACDVTQESQVKEVIDKIVSSVGIPRVCVNCAGIAPAKRLVGKNGVMPLADFANVIDVNLIGTVTVMRFIVEKMYQLTELGDDGERGVIINTASIAAYEGQIGQTAYSASKGGIVAMTLPAARELSQFGIRVMAVAPGVMDTPMMAQMSAETRETLTKQIPYPKRLGHAQEYAKLVKHIIENTYLNGSVIRLDGGLRMQ